MKRLLLTLSFVTLLLAAFVAAKNEYGHFLPSEGFGMSEIEDNARIENLFMGASTFNKGLDIEVLERLSGRTFMLAYNGNQPILIQKQLEYLIRRGVSIKRLFVDFYPYLVVQRPSLSDTRMLLDTDMQFKINLWQHLTSAYQRPFIDRLTEAYEFFVSANNTTILWYPLYRRQSLARYRHGGQSGVLHSLGSTKTALDRQPLFGKRDGMQESQLKAIREIIDICAANQIDLRFVELPKYHRLLQAPDYVAFADQISKVIEESAGSGHIIRADQFQLDTSEPSYFMDLVHMSGIGAQFCSERLFAMIDGA